MEGQTTRTLGRNLKLVIAVHYLYPHRQIHPLIDKLTLRIFGSSKNLTDEEKIFVHCLLSIENIVVIFLKELISDLELLNWSLLKQNAHAWKIDEL